MLYPPANDEQTLLLNGNIVHLRPSLRAAAHLERLHDGFAELYLHIGEFSIGTIREIIAVAATNRQQAKAFLGMIDTIPLSVLANAVAAPIMALISGCIPTSSDEDKIQTTGKPMPWRAVYKELFRTATGWLGWSPETAWNATPTEINEAFGGYVGKLKAIHGNSDKAADNHRQPDHYSANRLAEIEAQGFDAAFDREALTSLRSQIARQR